MPLKNWLTIASQYVEMDLKEIISQKFNWVSSNSKSKSSSETCTNLKKNVKQDSFTV